MSVRIMNSNHQAEKPRCCAGEHPQNHQAIEAKSATGMTFKIEGLDCAEEVGFSHVEASGRAPPDLE